MTIHYHGTPITPRNHLTRMIGRNFCVSFARPEDVDTVLSIGASVMFDNGAFTAYTQGTKLDVPSFLLWVGRYLRPPHWAVIPDVIGGPENQQREALAAWPFSRYLGAPVWHMDKPEDYLRYLCDSYPRVCIGSAGDVWQLGTPEWFARLDSAWENVLRFYPGTWVHGLRMTAFVDDYPFASVDSSNVGRNHKNAARVRCAEDMARYIDGKQSPAAWRDSAAGVRAMMRHITSLGL